MFKANAMKLRRKYTIAWLAWGLMFAVIEGLALANRDDGDTLSEHVREWQSWGGSFVTASILALLGWLAYHFTLEKRNQN